MYKVVLIFGRQLTFGILRYFDYQIKFYSIRKIISNIRVLKINYFEIVSEVFQLDDNLSAFAEKKLIF